VSPDKTLAAPNYEEPKLLRRLADLVRECRSQLCGALDAQIAVTTSPDTTYGCDGRELDALSALVHVFALKILERLGLSHLLGHENQHTNLRTMIGAMQNASAQFCHYSLPVPQCLSGAGEDALHRIWQMLHAEELDPLWQQPTTLGYAYQYFWKPLRRETQTRIQSANKELSSRQLIAFTQLYTPRWIVQFLLQNTILPQIAEENLPAGLVSDMLLPFDAENVTGKLTGAKLSEFTLIDPSCGSGHFLVHAFEILADLHQRDGRSEQQSAELALSQIHGLDIDRPALAVCGLAMLASYIQRCTALPKEQWNGLAAVDSDVLGSLNRNLPDCHKLMQKYSVVVTNPPYIGRKLMSRELKAGLKQQFNGCHHDLCAPFMVRGLELLKEGGRLGFITQASLLSLPSFTPVRELLSSRCKLACAVELGSGVFPLQGGDKVSSVLIVAEAPHSIPESRPTAEAPSIFIDLSNSTNKWRELLAIAREMAANPRSAALKNVFRRNLSVFRQSPRLSFQYKCPEFLFDLFSRLPALSSIADVRQGLATTDNTKFLRYWWEVEPTEIGTTWFPYIKGAGTERWTSPILHVVNFADNGREIKKSVSEKYPYLKGKTAWVVKNEQYYFRPGLCFSFVSTEQFAVRLLPSGCIFDVAASAIFVPDEQKLFLLAYLNSRLMRAICKLFNPTINVQVGDVKRLPMLTFSEQARQELSALAQECCALKEKIDSILVPGLASAKAPFSTPMLSHQQTAKHSHELIAHHQSCLQRLKELERSIDQIVLTQPLELCELKRVQQEELEQWVEEECAKHVELHVPVNEKELAELSLLYAGIQGEKSAVPERLLAIANRHFRGKLPRFDQ